MFCTKKVATQGKIVIGENLFITVAWHILKNTGGSNLKQSILQPAWITKEILLPKKFLKSLQNHLKVKEKDYVDLMKETIVKSLKRAGNGVFKI